MSITSGALSKSFVVVSDTPPASPFEGQLWRDTQNDVLKQWDGSSWVSVQTSIDDNTLVKNSNGNIEVVKPSQEIIGDWESTTPGGWNNKLGSPSVAQNNDSKRGEYSLEFTNSSNDYQYNFEIDVSDYSELRCWVYADGSFSGNELQYSGLAIQDQDDSSEVYDVNSTGEHAQIPSAGEWVELIIDVSSYSGTFYVEIGGRQTPLRFDGVKLVKPKSTTINTGAGN